jgi:pimeloyl-ACP methyl ester carboxylesterase
MEYRKTLTLDVDDGGSNSLPVVFLHGLAGSKSQWKNQLAHLRPSRRAIALDLRGHGQSPIPTDGDYGIEVLAKDVTATLDRLGVKKSALVGHSAGAAVAIACTREKADRVAGLLLVDPVGDQRRLPEAMMKDFLAGLASEAYEFTIERWWEEILRGAHESSRENILADLRSTPPSVVLGWFRTLLEFDPVAPLRRYRGPLLSVITPFNNASFSLHNLMPALRHVLVTETSHWPHMDKPDRVNQILDDFLKEVEAN